jgi:hypothetical protein
VSTVLVGGVRFDLATARVLCGQTDPDECARRDLADLHSGAHTRESLLAFCLDGSEPEDCALWGDYVSTLALAAERLDTDPPSNRDA